MSEYSKIIGHENIISQLISAVSMSKINHAYIFNGPDGSGKNKVNINDFIDILEMW